MPYKLKNLRIIRNSLVDAGANPGAKIVLFKRDESTKQEGDGMDETQIQKLIEDAIKPFADLSGQIDALKTENDELRKRLAGVHQEQKMDETPVTKADLEKLSPASREAVEKALEVAAESRKRIEKLEHENALNKEISRIEKQYPNLPDEARPFAEMLLKADPEERKRIERLLDVSNAATGGVLKGIGYFSGDQQDDAYETLKRKAAEIRKGSTMSFEQAIDRARAENPDLAREVMEE